MAEQITLKGNSMFHTPGVVLAMANDYRIGTNMLKRLEDIDEDDLEHSTDFALHRRDLYEAKNYQWKSIEVISNGWSLSVFKVRQILNGDCELKEDGGDLIVMFPDE